MSETISRPFTFVKDSVLYVTPRYLNFIDQGLSASSGMSAK